MSTKKCRVCGSTHLQPLIDFGLRPITKFLVTETQKGTEKLFPVMLDVCSDCSFVQMTETIPDHELYTNYGLFSSWKMQDHILDEIRLISERCLQSSNDFIIEIGCNDGLFLHALKQAGLTNTLGIEPSRDAFERAQSAGFNVQHAFFGQAYAEEIRQKMGPARLVVTRQVMEHVAELGSFLQGIATLLDEGGQVLIEVPDFDEAYRHGDMSLMWEEHVNHFTELTLRQLLLRYGLMPLYFTRYNFSGGALCVLAQKMKYSLSNLEQFLCTIDFQYEVKRIQQFPQQIEKSLSQMIQEIEAVKNQGQKVVLYGAGNRAVILLNYALKDYIDFVVDDQPEKQNRLIPCCHTPVYSSEALYDSQIGLCLLAVGGEIESIVIQRHQALFDRIRVRSVLAPYLSQQGEKK